jgi:hypothetical protein
MSSVFEKITCWTEKTAGEAGFHTLGSRNSVDDAMVLATKVDIPVRPFGSGETLSIDDFVKGFVSTFDIETENTIYAITGDSGSGKTFLIRCAQSQVDEDNRAHVVYVPRDVSSLHGILKLILAGLPGEAAAQALGEVEASNFEELELELLLRLVHAQIGVELAQGHGLHTLLVDESLTENEKVALEQLYGVKDENGSVYRKGIAEYLTHPDVMKHLLRQDGALWKHVQAMRGDLADEVHPITENEILSLSPRVARALNLDNFLFYLNDKDNKKIAARIVETVRVAAMAAQVRTTRNLSEIVGEARDILDSQGKQLVLMFEDIARNGVGLSDAVFDLFRPSGVKHHKPIRVMFATTVGYWSQIPQNVTSTCRRFEVRNLTVGEEQTQQLGLEIIAKYLNVARLGKKAVLDAWSSNGSLNHGTGDWVPNKCLECTHRQVCHAEFGHINGIGLYPLNKKAAQNVLTHLEEVNSNPGFSPRQIVRMVIAEWLRNSESTLKSDKFPTAQIEEIIGSRVSTVHVDGSTTELERAKLPRETIDRVFRTRVAWANNDTTGDSITKDLARAFGLNIETGDTEADNAKTQEELPPPETTVAPVQQRNQEKRFIAEVTDIAQWANSQDKPAMAPGRVEVLREFLVGLVKQSLRLDRYLIRYAGKNVPTGQPSEVKSLIDGYLQPISVRIEGGKGDEANALRMQRKIERSGDSYLLIAAALWYIKTGTWESEYNDGVTLWKCDARINVRGRQLLMSWVDEFANEVTSRIRSVVGDATEVSLLAQIRLLSLKDSSILNDSVEQSIAKLTNIFGEVEAPYVNSLSSELGQLMDSLDSLGAETLTAYQEDGDTRLAEDLVAKHRLLNAFTGSPEWRTQLSMKSPSQMVAMNQKIGQFSIELASTLELGGKTLSEFIEEIQKIDLLEFNDQLNDFNHIFESVVSRRHTSQQPQKVRDVIQVVSTGIQSIVQSKEELLEDLKGVGQMSDPQIWRLVHQFPFVSNWTLNYQDLKKIVNEIHAELDQRVGNQVLPDVPALKTEIKKSLDAIDVPVLGESNGG